MSDSPALFHVLPAGAAADGLKRAQLSAILACWPVNYQPVARDALARHPRRSVVVHGGEQWLSRWDARWLATWIGGVLRLAPHEVRELVLLADADGPGQ